MLQGSVHEQHSCQRLNAYFLDRALMKRSKNVKNLMDIKPYLQASLLTALIVDIQQFPNVKLNLFLRVYVSFLFLYIFITLLLLLHTSSICF